MAITQTPVISVSPSPSVAPSATPVATQSLVLQPAPSVAPVNLATQLGHVDPLIWAALVGALVVPFLQQWVKKFATFLNDPKHRTTNYLITGVVNLLVGYAFTLQNSGVLARLHNPVLAGVLTTALSFLLGQQVYGFFIKTNEQLSKVVPPNVVPPAGAGSELPLATQP